MEQSDGRLTDGQLTEIEKTPKLIQRKLSSQSEDLKNFEEAKALFSGMEKAKSSPIGSIRITDVSKPAALPKMNVPKITQKAVSNQPKSSIFDKNLEKTVDLIDRSKANDKIQSDIAVKNQPEAFAPKRIERVPVLRRMSRRISRVWVIYKYTLLILNTLTTKLIA